MKFNKVLTLILRLMCGIGIVIPFWYLLVNFVFVVAVGQDPLFDLGNNYVMKHSYVYYLPEKKKENLYIAKRVIAEKVHKFAFGGPWLIGTTGKGWFAIQKNRRDVHYPISKSQLQTITGLDISSVRMEKDPWPYVIARPQAFAAKNRANRFCWILVFVVPITLGFAPYVWRRLRARSKRKDQPITG